MSQAETEELKHRTQQPDETRLEYMLRVAAAFIRKNCPDGRIVFDDAQCDGACVADDCDYARAEARAERTRTGEGV